MMHKDAEVRLDVAAALPSLEALLAKEAAA
jgi:hypothetical protein